jgi:hypothetical protein
MKFLMMVVVLGVLVVPDAARPDAPSFPAHDPFVAPAQPRPVLGSRLVPTVPILSFRDGDRRRTPADEAAAGVVSRDAGPNRAPSSRLVRDPLRGTTAVRLLEGARC